MNETTPALPLPVLMCNLLDKNKSDISMHWNVQAWLEKNHIYKLPEVCYQGMYSIAQMVQDEDERKEKVKKVLLDWIAEQHPDKNLSSFCDLSTKEARAIHPQLEWGMYIHLLPVSGFKPCSPIAWKPRRMGFNLLTKEEAERYLAGVDPYRKEEDTNSSAVQIYSTNDNDGNGTAKDHDMWNTSEAFQRKEHDQPTSAYFIPAHTEDYLFSGMSAEDYRRRVLGEQPNSNDNEPDTNQAEHAGNVQRRGTPLLPGG